MKIYVTGGAVRDTLMGLPPKDIDYVVVGSSPAEMEALGFEKVGASFPVYLKNGEEYALARQERKVGVGYNGFEVMYDSTVTLEDDLIRRDLTMNSMAVDLDNWDKFRNARSNEVRKRWLIDPHNGLGDLNCYLIKHTSQSFADDPVRVLRTARFAARYDRFWVHSDTMTLMATVVHEIEFVPRERIWTEVHKGLCEDNYWTMFHILREVGALDQNCLTSFSKFDAIAHTFNRTNQLTPIERFAILSFNFSDQDYVKLTVPNNYSRLSQFFWASIRGCENYKQLTPVQKVELFERMRVFNEFNQITAPLLNCMISAIPSSQFSVVELFSDYVRLISVDTTAIASQFTSGLDIKNAIKYARVNALC